MGICYYEPILAFRLSELTESVYIHGIIFSGILVSYSFMGLFVSYFSILLTPINMVSLGLLLSGFSNFLIGPSIFLPNSLILIAIGMYLSGATIVFANVPQIPIMLKYAENEFPNEKRKACDM